MKTQLFVLAVASLIYCFAQVNPPAMAQAGSTGGTVGKQDKSVSGSEEPAEPKSQRNQHHAVSPPREFCRRALQISVGLGWRGCWRRFVGLDNFFRWYRD